MSCTCVLSKPLAVLDDNFFTEEKFREWYNMLLDFSEASINLLREETGNIMGISYEVNTVLLREVVYDAIIGLKTIVDSDNNEVKEPNAFKIASYLGYWFLRHKPILFRVEKNLNIDEIVFGNNAAEADRNDIIVDIKHMNELVVARFLLRYIFQIDSSRPLCTPLKFKSIKARGCIYFDNFPDMLETIYAKLKYHLTYRDIAPKTIEHFLEAYTLHPYLPYTCDLWNSSGES